MATLRHGQAQSYFESYRKRAGFAHANVMYSRLEKIDAVEQRQTDPLDN